MSDDESHRLNRLEQDVSGLKNAMREIADGVSRIQGALPYMATKDDVAQIQGAVPYLGTKEDVEAAKHESTKAKNAMYASVVAAVVAGLAALLRFLPYGSGGGT